MSRAFLGDSCRQAEHLEQLSAPQPAVESRSFRRYDSTYCLSLYIYIYVCCEFVMVMSTYMYYY